MNKNGYNETEHDGEEVLPDRFIFNGTESELKSTLLTFMSEQDALSFINELPTINQRLGNDEFAEECTTYQSLPENHTGCLGFLRGSTDYNINITALTIVSIALLLDINLTLGFSATTLAILGVNSRVIVRLDVSGGEKCLVLEAMRSNNRRIDADVLSSYHCECIHNGLACRYKHEDKCTMGKDDIIRTLDGLCDKNVFRKDGAYYKYNF